jgi:hypothetical protein
MLEREEERGGRECIHPYTLAGRLLNGVPYAGWWRERETEEKGRRKVALC